MTKTLTFIKAHPNVAGQYLIRWKGECFGYEVITVYFRPKEVKYGVEWGEGFYISTWNHKHVSRINLDMVDGIAKL